MAEAQLLKKLHDIHLPEQVGWWPLAPGWYVLIILFLILLGYGLYGWQKRRRNSRPKREALSLLENYRLHYLQNKNSQLTSMKISELLRRVALVYYPREEVAGLRGQSWIDFLNSSSKHLDFNPVSHLLLELPYQPNKDIELEPLFQLARAWIRQRGVPCLN
ncbi:DUF4381 domain-containing protein [Legionella jordanis]|uniref:DUF4381 domain-containing protein n=1 Tax=Legionella jordanis TaxID=456 RepID=A0A0W0VD26_9GAMM|nr:DUF4381 domain-containing protein [Legionella jordanis]KTD18034.1 hypothetical protein Ljor_2340 [Legionella jordanis]RMX02279.1 DUF4381 domain-containing protein [Legionella jordanis]RMX21236.1 DUF4381 domain-containing protein [Legionella jordanis]VEH13874.1 Uncharacterised protein [Legionella jordanis]HAT8714256.1 DUF4381 family protein [Legionella jordanis]